MAPGSGPEVPFAEPAGRRRGTGRAAGRPAPELDPDPVVVALPRGGVPVGGRWWRDALGAPLDVIIVRKLGVPGAARAGDGRDRRRRRARPRTTRYIDALRITDAQLAAVEAPRAARARSTRAAVAGPGVHACRCAVAPRHPGRRRARHREHRAGRDPRRARAAAPPRSSRGAGGTRPTRCVELVERRRRGGVRRDAGAVRAPSASGTATSGPRPTTRSSTARSTGASAR